MWIAILFLCSSGGCDFVISDPLDSQTQCAQMLTAAYTKLEAAQDVSAYQGKCFQIRQA